MAKKGLLRKSVVPAALALSSIMCLSTFATVANRNISASASTAAAASTALFTSDYNSREEVLQATLDLNDEIAAEGMVLVKNENEALPMIGTKPRVSVFGYASTHVTVGASNAGGDTSAGEARADSDLYTSLADAGFVVNPATRSFYENAQYKQVASTGGGMGGPGGGGGSGMANDATDNGILKAKSDDATWDDVLKGVEYTYNSYSDAAIVMLSDVGSGESAHSRDYDDAQKSLVEYLGKKFDKVILLINNSYPFELGWAEEADYVDAILIVGQPGNNGFNAVGKILNGEVNPSGHLADLYANDFTVTPSYNNFNVSGVATGMVQYQDASGSQLGQTYLYQYEEGIYVGYHYYETMAALDGIKVDVDLEKYPDGMKGQEWYDAHVVYPFGYGLSYTTFEYSNFKVTGEVSATGKITATVTVTNTGDVAGKDVVQLYYNAPWEVGQVEKSFIELGDYAKTRLLQPGESQKVSISINAADMASYDYNLDNGSGKAKGGYVLDAGNYTISLRSNSHTVLEADGDEANKVLTLDTRITSGLNLDTEGNDVHNQFQDITDTVTKDGSLKFDSALSRATMATKTTTAITAAEGASPAIKLTAAEVEDWEEGMRMRAGEDDVLYSYWADKNNPELDGHGPADTATREATAKVTASQLIGKPYDDALWDDLLDELSINELQALFTRGGYGTIALDYIGLPGTHNMDGPYGWTSARGDGSWGGIDAEGNDYNNTGNGLKTGNEQFPLFCSEVIVACTFNKELAYREGQMIGEQGLWGNAENGGSANTWTGYYSPGMNIHRSPFDSRGTEYYSEDPVLTGYSAANLALGAQEKGTFVTLKHFAVYNDGAMAYRSVRNTTDNSGFSVWADEQTLRETYLKGFEIAVKTGSATGVMTSFAKIGYLYNGANYALCTEVLRNEWGFNGIVVSDIVFYANQDGEMMVLAGNNLALIKANTTWNKFNADGTLDVSGGGGVINVLYEYIYADNGADDFDAAFAAYLEDEPYAATALYNALREGAHGIIYTIVNSNAMQVPYGATVNYTNNGAIESVVAGKAIEAVDLGGAQLSTVAATYPSITGATVSYAVTEGALPTGLSLNAATGELTGTPTGEGTYSFTVTASAKGYESASVEYTVTVVGDNSDVLGAIGDIDTTVDNSDVLGAIGELENKVDDLATKVEAGGCSGTVAATVIPVSIALLGIGVAIIVKRSKRTEK